VSGIHDDSGNTLLLWVGGAFRSKKYPISWKYNTDHENDGAWSLDCAKTVESR
jgi:hypothetical protein